MDFQQSSHKGLQLKRANGSKQKENSASRVTNSKADGWQSLVHTMSWTKHFKNEKPCTLSTGLRKTGQSLYCTRAARIPSAWYLWVLSM